MAAKTPWPLIVLLPQCLAGNVDDRIQPTVFSMPPVVLVYLAVPWPYVLSGFVTAGRNRWH